MNISPKPILMNEGLFVIPNQIDPLMSLLNILQCKAKMQCYLTLNIMLG